MDPLIVSASVRFQTGFSLILFILSGCIAFIELIRHGHGAEGWTMGMLVVIAIVLGKRAAGHLLQNDASSNETYITPEQIVRAK